MAVFRVDKNRNYTVMSNHHLQNTELSLKAKGLLSLMLSLPDNWDYTTKGLVQICKDGADSVRAGLQELEQQGYLIRKRERHADGTLGTMIYTVMEEPVPPKPIRENPAQVPPTQAAPMQENLAQLNTKESITNQSNTKGLNTFPSSTPPHTERNGIEAREAYQDVIYGNIDYDVLVSRPDIDREQLGEIAQLIVDTVCTARKTIRISGDDFPAEVVKSRFLKLDSNHILFVMDGMKENTTKIRNIKKYLLAALYNAPVTMNSYYAARVQHDLYGGDG